MNWTEIVHDKLIEDLQKQVTNLTKTVLKLQKQVTNLKNNIANLRKASREHT